MLVNFGYGLSFKALNPSSMGIQNVNLALKVFSRFVAGAVRSRRGKVVSIYIVWSLLVVLFLEWKKMKTHSMGFLACCFHTLSTKERETL